MEGIQSHSQPHPTIKLYLIVFVWLFVITAVEVGLGYLSTGIEFSPELTLSLPKELAYPGLLTLSAAKALLVALYYMHLRYDNRWFLGIMLISMPLAVLFILVVVLGFRILAP